MQYYFYNKSSLLSVNMKLLNLEGSIPLLETGDISFVIATDVDSSRHARFNTITDDNGVMIDDFQRYSIK